MHIGCCLNPVFKVAFNDFISSGGLIVCCQKKAHQPFAALGDCLKNKTKEQDGSPPVENTVKQRRREGPGGGGSLRHTSCKVF